MMTKKALLTLAILSTVLFAHNNPANVWKISDLNQAAIALYGEEAFSQIQKSEDITIVAPTAIAQDPQNIPLGIK